MSERRARIASFVGCVLALAACLTPLAFIEPVRVDGASMRPALRPGDVVLVRRDAEPGRGEIALIREPGRAAVLHRVVGFEEDGRLRTRGDANPIGDLEPVPIDAVAGRVVAVWPLGNILSRWR